MRKRIITMCVSFILVLSFVIGRIGYISMSGNFSVGENYNSYSLTIGAITPTIYDRNKKKLTNKEKQLVAIIRPDEKCLNELSVLFNQNEIKEITKELSLGYPIIKDIDTYKKTDNIIISERYIENSDDMLCRQLLSKSSSGLEKYTDKKTGERKVNFSVDAKGQILSGDSVKIVDDNYNSKTGVVTTIDMNIQKIAEEASKSISKGAVVILDANTSEILASVSRPNDYYNRAIANYSIGSIFKLVVASCAIENGIDPMYECTGSVKIGDTTYSCQHDGVHSKQHIKEALANSCNCYFVNLALKLGRDKLLKTTDELGFTNDIELYKNWNVKSANLPSAQKLASKGELSLFGFGQGYLTDTPLHFASVVATISNGGTYNSPTLITSDEDAAGKKVFSNETSTKMRKYMRFVVSNGTGKNAEYMKKTAGKTATAQSGQYIDNKEILHTYFAGIYPYDEPKYVIVVMNEDGISGSEDCCPVFRTIVENLSLL